MTDKERIAAMKIALKAEIKKLRAYTSGYVGGHMKCPA
jgi:hypothetical protein